MTHFNHSMSSRFTAAVLTLLFSTLTVLGAVGPAYTSTASSPAATTLANTSGESANSLA